MRGLGRRRRYGDATMTNQRPSTRRAAAADLLEQVFGSEVALVDLVSRSIVERSLLPFDWLAVRSQRRIDDDQLRRDPARLGEKPQPV